MILTLCIIFLLALLALGVPVGFSMAIVGVVGLSFALGFDSMLGVLATAPLSSVSSYELITVPMFLLMAEFVILSGLADTLFEAAATWVGRTRGGLAIATSLAGAGFAAISGSSTASAATLSATTIPSMIKQGYEPAFACGVVAISGTLAMLIPPSIALILYGLITEENIGRLLIAGIIPGILVTITIILTILVLAALYPKAVPRGEPYKWSIKLSKIPVIGPMALLFFLVMGVIYTGIATPTEASALGALGAMLLALKEGGFTKEEFLHSVIRASRTSCMIFMIILGAQIFGYFVAFTNVTNDMVTLLHNLELSRWVVIGVILVIIIIMGCFMDQVAILFLSAPIFVPLIKSYGFDPIWFGVIMVVTGELGMVTPPVGMNAFVIARYTNRSLVEIFRGVMPHIFAHLIIISVLVAFPILTLWLPNKMG